VLYAAAGNQGDLSEVGGVWSKLGLPTGPNWISIAGLSTGPATAGIYVGDSRRNRTSGIVTESASNINGVAVDKSGHFTVVFGGDGSITGSPWIVPATTWASRASRRSAEGPWNADPCARTSPCQLVPVPRTRGDSGRADLRDVRHPPEGVSS
jgi:hypothetical protein